ncbi:hypothetical protein GCK32_022878 [Trichostrongylus colubriformis]|uniref:Uncharacterized protein n=1 Tax=Trichostrongylus colubriformis TaxID=6319 RepID=A0AAN8IHS4_TRICO
MDEAVPICSSVISIDTLLAPAAAQGRQGKKHRLDLSSTTAHSDFDRAIDLVAEDTLLPSHLKTAMGFLFGLKDQIGSLLAWNKELLEENKSILLKNSELMNQVKRALSSHESAV